MHNKREWLSHKSQREIMQTIRRVCGILNIVFIALTAVIFLITAGMHIGVLVGRQLQELSVSLMTFLQAGKGLVDVPRLLSNVIQLTMKS